MPTPSGKPKAGEWIYAPDGQLIGQVVTRHGNDDMYSVTLRNGKRIRLITEFGWYMRLYGWKIEPTKRVKRSA